MHLYIHIPFCKQACHYCDFHFSTNTTNKRAVTEAIAKEIIIRQDYLPTNELETIYFGGGTPSMLDESELKYLFDTIHTHFKVSPGAEITLEANPDDLNPTKLAELAKAGINRLSIGIQSFHEPHLKFLNRAHSASEAQNCVKYAQDAGIDNISIDLIYAIPTDYATTDHRVTDHRMTDHRVTGHRMTDHQLLMRDMELAFELDVAHISAYCLTIEPQTAFGNWVKKNKLKPIDEEFAATEFEILKNTLATNGYEQYEISNFARNGRYSRHNSSYWKQKPYLGVGPSAHSYNGESRESNISNNGQYVAALKENRIPSNYERLSAVDKTNEYLLTGLRTKWGCQVTTLENLSENRFQSVHHITLAQLIAKGWLMENTETLILTESGKLFADRVASDLFLE